MARAKEWPWHTTENDGKLYLFADGDKPLTEEHCIRLATLLLSHADWVRRERDRARDRKRIEAQLEGEML